MKKILLIATGSVAIVKLKLLKKILLENNYDVRIIATNYVQNNFAKQLEINFEKEDNKIDSFPKHIELAKWADLMVVVPASANTLSKFNLTIADNFALTTLIASRNRVLFVPAMNTWMYKKIVDNIINNIIKKGHLILGPINGMLREGESGLGRMLEPDDIVKYINNYFKPNKKIILIPFGSSKVWIDKIRYITTGSTGEMAKYIENALVLNGYNVIKKDISKLTNKEFIEYAKDINYDIFISPAAFADFDTKIINHKIRKKEINEIKLKENIDVISTLKNIKPNKKYYAFKLDNDFNNAINKMKNLNLDGIVWNTINSFGDVNISGEFILKNKKIKFNNERKEEVAKLIVKNI